MFIFIFGAASIIVSAVASRTRNKGLFITAWILIGLNLMLMLGILEFLEWFMKERNMFMLIILFCLLFIPIAFQVKYIQDTQPKSTEIDSSSTSFDGASSGGEVTEEYLDEVINAPDEEINFDDEYDLR